MDTYILQHESFSVAEVLEGLTHGQPLMPGLSVIHPRGLNARTRSGTGNSPGDAMFSLVQTFSS
jgi:hypothetical protein